MLVMEQVLQQYFGYSTFRPLQKDIITDVIHNCDVLAVMPTGSGKSLCYQIPALLHPRKVTIVVSPLIALMKDQVDGLRQNGVNAACLNSSLSSSQQQEVKQQLVKSELSLLYVAPERLSQQYFLDFLQTLQIQLFAIDEAHCISEWGHDFRPDYRELKKLRQLFPAIPILALTATATPQVKTDIEKQLQLRGAKKYQASFDRKNLMYIVQQKQSAFEQVLAYVKNHAGESGIIYCQSRKDVDAMADYLQRNNSKALPYHAGLPNEQRQKHQEMFIREDVDIIVATIAFGMGIDKSNVRFVIHADLPKSLEGYYQETGRAGRDSLPSECILLYSYGDKRKSEFFIHQKEPAQQVIAHKQLEDMIHFAKYKNCRRIALLQYFGEEYSQKNCKLCDNCLNPKDTFDATIIAQKILSCVYRVNQRFGMKHVIAILTGAKSSRITGLGHDKLSTYGIVTDYTEKQLQMIIHELIDAEYLQIAGEQYPLLALTEKSAKVLKKEEQVFLPVLELKEPRRRKEKLFASSVHADLFEKLRILRKQFADEQQVPPYVVFPDSSLHAMASYLPQTKTEFRNISGVGEHKLETYGDAFIKAIKAYCEQHNILPITPAVSHSVRKRTPRKSVTIDETVRLFRDGLSIEAIAQQRGFATSTIAGHLSDAYMYGESISIDHLVPQERQQKIIEVFHRLGYEKLAPVREVLGEEYSYDELRLVQAMVVREKKG